MLRSDREREREKGDDILEEKRHLRNSFRILLRGVLLKPTPGKS
jgi:hypothetical protein